MIAMRMGPWEVVVQRRPSPLPGRLAVGRATLRAAWRTWRTRRHLAELDDRMLADLGISRAQARFEAERRPWDLGPRC